MFFFRFCFLMGSCDISSIVPCATQQSLVSGSQKEKKTRSEGGGEEKCQHFDPPGSRFS